MTSSVKGEAEAALACGCTRYIAIFFVLLWASVLSTLSKGIWAPGAELFRCLDMILAQIGATCIPLCQGICLVLQCLAEVGLN